jgi:hypothetical protein
MPRSYAAQFLRSPVPGHGDRTGAFGSPRGRGGSRARAGAGRPPPRQAILELVLPMGPKQLAHIGSERTSEGSRPVARGAWLIPGWALRESTPGRQGPATGVRAHVLARPPSVLGCILENRGSSFSGPRWQWRRGSLSAVGLQPQASENLLPDLLPDGAERGTKRRHWADGRKYEIPGHSACGDPRRHQALPPSPHYGSEGWGFESLRARWLRVTGPKSHLPAMLTPLLPDLHTTRGPRLFDVLEPAA